MNRKKTKKIIKSADDGEIKSKEFAAENPLTTYELTVPTGKGEVTVAVAVKVLTDALRKDSDFFFGYQSNIAMAMYDAWQDEKDETLVETFNRGAKRFLDLFISQSETSSLVDSNESGDAPVEIVDETNGR